MSLPEPEFKGARAAELPMSKWPLIGCLVCLAAFSMVGCNAAFGAEPPPAATNLHRLQAPGSRQRSRDRAFSVGCGNRAQ